MGERTGHGEGGGDHHPSCDDLAGARIEGARFKRLP
jgi:hypothetical protein